MYRHRETNTECSSFTSVSIILVHYYFLSYPLLILISLHYLKRTGIRWFPKGFLCTYFGKWENRSATSACQAEVWFWNYLLSRQCSKNIIFHSKKSNTYALYSVRTSSQTQQLTHNTLLSGGLITAIGYWALLKAWHDPVCVHTCMQTHKMWKDVNFYWLLTLASLYTFAFLSSCIFYTCFVPALCSSKGCRQMVWTVQWGMMPRVVKNSKVTFQYLGLLSHVFLGSFPKIGNYEPLQNTGKKNLHSCLWCQQNWKRVISIHLEDIYKIWEIPLSFFHNILVFLCISWLNIKHYSLLKCI